MKTRISAQHLLDKYAISSPEEIDLEAIALCENAEVRYSIIKGCEARLVGFKDRAIITINDNVPVTRQRFSLAHELGHWVLDRGTVGKLCKKEDISSSAIQDKKKIDWGEIAVNKFAADLIMPMSFFKESSKGNDINFETVARLSEVFQTSTLATAIRLIDADHFPCALAYSIGRKIAWMHKSKTVPKDFYYNSYIGDGALAAKLHPQNYSSNYVPADNWFSVRNADKYYVLENSVQYHKGVLSILWWENEAQILHHTS